MIEPKTYEEYCYAMRLNATVIVNTNQGKIRAMTMEDGSGKNYIITMLINDGTCTGEKIDTFVRIP